jgi:hypothetical protein
MNRQISLLGITILIGLIGSLPGARDHGVRLPSCVRMLQMEAAVGAIGYSNQSTADQS